MIKENPAAVCQHKKPCCSVTAHKTLLLYANSKTLLLCDSTKNLAALCQLKNLAAMCQHNERYCSVRTRKTPDVRYNNKPCSFVVCAITKNCAAMCHTLLM